jgi:hypothetical protein
MRTLWIVAVALALTPLVSVGDPPNSTKERLDNLEEDLDKLAQEVEQINGTACSATQQDNSVLITCGDGTSGVIAGAGTVVLYPEGQIGEVPPIDFNTGPVVAVDGSGVVLGEVLNLWDFDDVVVAIRIEEDRHGQLLNIHSTQQVVFSPNHYRLIFPTEDCSGPALMPDGIVEVDNQLFIAHRDAYVGPILVKSWMSSGGWIWDPALAPDGLADEPIYLEPSECYTDNYFDGGFPMVEYTLAPEIANAVYPVTVEQLPQ